MNFDDLKKSVGSLSAKAKGFLERPDVKDYVDMANRGLDVAARLGQAHLKGPVAVAGAVAGAANVLLGGDEKDTYELFRTTALRLKLAYLPGFYHGIFRALYEMQAFENSKLIFTHHNYSLRLIEVDRTDGGGKVQFGFCVHPNTGFDTSYGPYVSRKGESELLPLFMQHFQCNLMSIKAGSARNHSQDATLIPTPIRGYDNLVYAGEKDPKRFADDFRAARSRGLSQAFLLAGPPGSGKTTFVFRVGEELGGSVLVLDPSIFANTSVGFLQDLLKFIKLYSPSVVLFDDVDNVGRDGLLLMTLDVLRRESPEVLVMSATNYPNQILPALRRPGRLGRRLTFDAPSEAGRRDIIRAYGERYGTRDLQFLAPLMSHPLFTPDYIKDVVEKSAFMSDVELVGYVRENLHYLREMNGEKPARAEDEAEDEDED